MFYLARPVWQFPLNRKDNVPRSFTFDLREEIIGFNEEVFTSRGQYVVNGWKLNLELTTEFEIKQIDDFFTGRLGSLLGFWFPVPQRAMPLVSIVSGTEFDITYQGLASTWNTSADQHLYFDTGFEQGAAKIVNVVDNGIGTERVTIDTPIFASPAFLTLSCAIYRIHYVRLAGDTEQARVIQEQHQQREITVVELPHEYTTAETGQRPIFLYHLWSPSPVDYHWYYTSFEADVISQNNTHRHFQITHGALKASMKFESQECDIKAAYEADHPLTLFLPTPNGRPINVEIKQCYFSDPNTTITLFVGSVRTVDDNGTHIQAKCDSYLSVLRKKIPPMLIKADCPYQVYEPHTCRANVWAFSYTGRIMAIDNTAQPPTVDVQLRGPNGFGTTELAGNGLLPNWFREGWIETGKRLDYELRTILLSAQVVLNIVRLTLNAPLVNAVAGVGQEVWLAPGCDGKVATCKLKFGNFENFGGFVDLPTENPSIAAIEAVASAGDKK